MEWSEDYSPPLVPSSSPFQSSPTVSSLVTQDSSLPFGELSPLSFTSVITIWHTNHRLWRGAPTPFRWFSSSLLCCCSPSAFTQVCLSVSFALTFGGKGRNKSKRILLPIWKFSVLPATINTNTQKDRRLNQRNHSIFLSFWRWIGQTPMNVQSINEWWQQESADWGKGLKTASNKTNPYFI